MGREVTLAIMAHADDAEIWAGGTLLKHSALGEVIIIIPHCNSTRSGEARRGAAKLNAESRMIAELNYDSCLLLLNQIQPSVVISHRIDDPHPDHNKIGTMVTHTLQKYAIGRSDRVLGYWCDTYESITTSGLVPGRMIVNIENEIEGKLAAIAEHVSQPIDHFSTMVKRQGRTWGARIGKEWGEAFDPIPILGILPGFNNLSNSI